MSDSTVRVGGGIGLGGALFLVLLVLKLTDNIDLSWWWVTAPLWIPYAIALAVVVIGAVIMGVLWLFESEQDRRNRKAREAIDRYSRSLR